MTIPFDAFFRRVAESTGITTQMGLADALGVNRSAVTQAKLRNAVPQKWILALARRNNLSPDWLEFGTGGSRSGAPSSGAARSRQQAVESLSPPTTGGPVVLIPKVRARLCAGGGSLECEAVPVSEHAFPRSWLARMGNPSSMVFMDVVGDSMAPDIQDGDMVLVDQSVSRIVPRAVMAVGIEDAIYIKRVETRGDGLIIRSDNPDYAPVELYGDELSSFRVIGKVVWLCRDV